MSEALHCIGCGAQIQTENPSELGYTPKSALEKGIANDEVYCQRCFRLRHYNEIQDVSLTDDDFLRIRLILVFQASVLTIGFTKTLRTLAA